MSPYITCIVLYLALQYGAARTLPPLGGGALRCRNIMRSPPTTAYCKMPPTVAINLTANTDSWFNLYNTGSAASFTPNSCVTAHYSANEAGQIDVTNCYAPNNGSKPICVHARAAPVSGGRLSVMFPRPLGLLSPGQYNVAAVPGSSKSQYLVAAVYQCLVMPDGRTRPGFFVLSRTRDAPWLSLLLIRLKLR